MNGADWRALVRFSNKTDETLALPGQTCERVPAEALPWALQTGRIEPVDAAWIDLGAPEHVGVDLAKQGD